MPVIELGDVRVVDNHCHAVQARQLNDPAAFRAYFTESPDPSMRAVDAGESAFYRRLLHRMAAFHGVSPTEEAVLEARAALSAEQLVAGYLPEARVGGLVIDTGFPTPDTALEDGVFDAASGAHRVTLLRLEVEFQQLVAEHDRYDDLLGAVRAALADVRGRGFAGLKSIVGYRTGLAVERWSDADARASFAAARDEAARTGAVRLGHKPLLDTLLHTAFEAAAAQELPLQFHVGYGDPDADLRRAAPLELRAVLEEPAYRPMPVVLLHGCWPYFREGAYLASVYPNAWLDLSYGIPFLSTAEMRSMTRAALGVVPFSKVMYSSDGGRVPEIHWMSAHDGRRVIGETLGELVADGDLDETEARTAGERILRDNAADLYGVEVTR